MIFEILPIYHINSRRMKRKQDDEVEKDWEEDRVGGWQEVESGRLVGVYSEGGRASLLMASPRGPN